MAPMIVTLKHATRQFRAGQKVKVLKIETCGMERVKCKGRYMDRGKEVTGWTTKDNICFSR